MYIITVIPISRGIGTEELTYFSRKPLLPGAIVSVPVRKKHVPALVLDSTSVRQKKASVRGSTFALKKIGDVHTTELLSSHLISGLENTAEYFATTLGSVLFALVPKTILTKPPEVIVKKSQHAPGYELRALQALPQERTRAYAQHVHECLSKDTSLILLCPTTKRAEDIAHEIQKHEPIVLHSGLGARTLRKRWAEASHISPVCIVGTSMALTVPRHDLAMIILEEEHSSAYRHVARPFIDTRVAVQHIAQEYNIPLVVGGTALRTETLWRIQQKEIVKTKPFVNKYAFPSSVNVVDMRQYKPNKKGVLASLSDELASTLERVAQKKKHLFIFAARRGHAPTTLCNDCGTLVTCTHCGASVTLHEMKNKNGRMFVCHHCGTTRNAHETCASCGSWNLVALGIGIEHIEQELTSRFPDISCFRVDSDTTKTHTTVRNTVSKWYNTPGSVLIGTERALSYLDTADYTAISSLDALLATPGMAVAEKAFLVALSLRLKTQETLFIQTRDMDTELLGYIQTGTIDALYKREISLRGQFNYPPFSVLIEIRVQKKPEIMEQVLDGLEKRFAEYVPVVFPSYPPKAGALLRYTVLLSIPREHFPNPKLTKKLKSLPQDTRIIVNPL